MTARIIPLYCKHSPVWTSSSKPSILTSPIIFSNRAYVFFITSRFFYLQIASSHGNGMERDE